MTGSCNETSIGPGDSPGGNELGTMGLCGLWHENGLMTKPVQPFAHAAPPLQRLLTDHFYETWSTGPRGKHHHGLPD